jgi:CRP-like cAMP-binding protein
MFNPNLLQLTKANSAPTAEIPSDETNLQQPITKADSDGQFVSSLKDILVAKSKARRRLSTMMGPELPSNQPAQTDGGVSYSKNYVVSPPPTDSSTGNVSSKKPLIIRVTNPFRIKWDLFVMLLAAWNVFITPYFIAFKPAFSERESSMIVNTIVDMFFILDIVLNFRTTFYTTSTGDEIFEPSLIAKNYMLGKLWLDLLSCFPDDLLSYAYKDSGGLDKRAVDTLALFRMLKLSRVSRLNRIINFLRTKSDVKMLLRIGQLIFFLLMYLHLLACAWWMIVSYDEKWIYVVKEGNIFDAGTGTQYWFAFYNSVFFLTGGDTYPQTTMQACFAGTLILSGSIVTAVMFGDVALLMSNLNMRQTKFQEMQNALNTAMKNLRLPEPLQEMISDYLIYTEASMASREEFETFRSLISPSLYKQVLQHLYDAVIKQNDVFGPHAYIADFILPKLKPMFCKPEETIISQGDDLDGKSMHFVARGDVEVYIRDELKRDKFVTILRPGAHFGEVSLLTKQARTATVIALNYCTLAILSGDDFNQLTRTYPQVVSIFRQGMYGYNDRRKRFLLRTLTKVPFFKGLQWRTEQELLYSMKHSTLESDEYLIRPGKTSECIYFLIEGELEVSVTINDRSLEARRNFEYSLDHDEKPRPKDNWNMRDISRGGAMKRSTEVFPVLGQMGVEGSLHITELDSDLQDKKLLGQHCVEFVLDTLSIGSSIGHFTMMSNEDYIIQAKALTRCVLMAIDKPTIYRLRMTHIDLHKKLSSVESWCKTNIPYVDDYVVSNDELREFQVELNRRQGINRLRGAVLRIIKENRDRRILKTPTLAVVMKGMNLQDNALGLRKARQEAPMIKNVLKMSFDPKNLLRLQNKKKESRVDNEISQLKETMNAQARMIEELQKLLKAK